MNDYSKTDVWLKENPRGGFEDFKKVVPGITIWSFYRRRKALKMSRAYQTRKTSDQKRTYQPRKSARCVYTTVRNFPVEEIEKKSGMEAFTSILGILNESFNLHLEVVQVKLISSGEIQLELRRYNR